MRNLSFAAASSENKDHNEFHSPHHQSIFVSKNQLDSTLLSNAESSLSDFNPATWVASPDYLKKIIVKQFKEIDLSAIITEKDLQMQNKLLHAALHLCSKFLGIYGLFELDCNDGSKTHVLLCTSSYDSSCNLFKVLKRRSSEYGSCMSCENASKKRSKMIKRQENAVHYPKFANNCCMNNEKLAALKKDFVFQNKKIKNRMQYYKEKINNEKHLLHANIKDKQLIKLFADATKHVQDNRVTTEQALMQSAVTNLMSSHDLTSNRNEISNEARLLVSDIIEDIANWSKKFNEDLKQCI